MKESLPNVPSDLVAGTLTSEITQLIDSARQHVTTAVNASLALLYWQIGRRIQTEVLSSKRADYGQAIVATLSRQLVLRHGRGFTEKSLHRMVQSLAVFQSEKIVASLMRLFSLLQSGTCQSQLAHGRQPTRKSQLGSDPFAPLLAYRNTALAFGVRP
jgi:hypothetical protein